MLILHAYSIVVYDIQSPVPAGLKIEIESNTAVEESILRVAFPHLSYKNVLGVNIIQYIVI